MSLWDRLRQRLRKQYRFVIVDEDTYQQTFFFHSNLGRLMGLAAAALFATFLITTLFIVFTPVRELIPGYTDPKLEARQAVLTQRVQRLQLELAQRDSFIKAFQRASGYTPPDSAAQAPAGTPAQPSAQPTKPAPRPLMQAVTNEAPAQPAAAPAAPAEAAPALQWPLRGPITSRFDARGGHPALDIAAPVGTPVRAAADGFVILADYSDAAGYVLGLQHTGALVTFYKHNDALLKRHGSYARAGEAIALAGNAGTHTSGPHLHFEVWQNGLAQDPLKLLPPQ